jgi:hypothetical protein
MEAVLPSSAGDIKYTRGLLADVVYFYTWCIFTMEHVTWLCDGKAVHCIRKQLVNKKFTVGRGDAKSYPFYEPCKCPTTGAEIEHTMDGCEKCLMIDRLEFEFRTLAGLLPLGQQKTEIEYIIGDVFDIGIPRYIAHLIRVEHKNSTRSRDLSSCAPGCGVLMMDYGQKNLPRFRVEVHVSAYFVIPIYLLLIARYHLLLPWYVARVLGTLTQGRRITLRRCLFV